MWPSWIYCMWGNLHVMYLFLTRPNLNGLTYNHSTQRHRMQLGRREGMFHWTLFARSSLTTSWHQISLLVAFVPLVPVVRLLTSCNTISILHMHLTILHLKALRQNNHCTCWQLLMHCRYQLQMLNNSCIVSINFYSILNNAENLSDASQELVLNICSELRKAELPWTQAWHVGVEYSSTYYSPVWSCSCCLSIWCWIEKTRIGNFNSRVPAKKHFKCCTQKISFGSISFGCNI